MRNPRFIVFLLLGCCAARAVADEYVDPPGRVARVSFVDGAVSIAPAGSDEWGEAVVNRPLTTGDRIWADAGGRAELEVGSATLRLDENTGLGFDNLTDDVMQVHLSSGVMTLHAGSVTAAQIIEVTTPNTTVTLMQKGDYTIEAPEAGGQTVVKVRSGEATVAGASQRAYGVATNEQGVFNGTTDLTAEITGLEPPTQFEEWAYAREVRDQQSITARYVSPEVIGYRELDTYGTWYDEPEYGHVWSPTLLVDDWAPYRFGRWVWVSPWGWTWIDDAPWGFAPSHYGRWTYLRSRWCWVPGPAHIRPVYAPALVGWVGDPYAGPFVNPGYGGNIGWFPLAPREAYLPGYRASWRHFHNVNVSNTVIVNNTYINDAYQGRAAPIDYHNRHVPHALTVVQRDAFVSAHRVGDHRTQVTDDQLRTWPTQGRAPTIIPNRDSMIGTRVDTPRSAPHSDRWVNPNRDSAAPASTLSEHAAFGQPRQNNETRAQASNRPARPTQPVNPMPAQPQGGSHRAAQAQPPTAAPQAPAEQHVQRQWDGRHRDESTRAPGYAVPAPQQQSAPNIATLPAPQTYSRHAEPRQPAAVQPAPRANAPATPATVTERQQTAEPGKPPQHAAFGNPHGRHDQQNNGAANPRTPEQSDRSGAAGSPQQP